jgi:hypothetical protein
MPADTLAFQARILSDEHGHMTEWVYQNPEGEKTGNRIFALDPEGRRTGYKHYNKDGEQVFEQQYAYNEKGNMIRQLMIDREGKEYLSEYDYSGYDDRGNWTRLVADDQQHIIITERTITYHE